jgi:hypothetical protein
MLGQTDNISFSSGEEAAGFTKLETGKKLV